MAEIISLQHYRRRGAEPKRDNLAEARLRLMAAESAFNDNPTRETAAELDTARRVFWWVQRLESDDAS